MSTHRTQCVVCDRPTYCTDDHAIDIQGGCYESEPSVEFCSMACFRQLEDKMAEYRRHIEDEARGGNTDARRVLDDVSPAPAIVVPVGAVFEAYPQKFAAYVDQDGALVVRRRWFCPETARELAQWILDHVPVDP